MTNHPISPRLPAPVIRRTRPALAGLSIALALGAATPTQAEDWSQFQFNPGRIGLNADERAFTPDNVASLRTAFKDHFGTNLTAGGTATSDGRLFIGAFSHLAAFAFGGCLADSCEPLWLGDGDGAFTGTPGVSNNIAAIAATDGFLYAFSAQGCGKAHCKPLWRGRLNGPSLDSSVLMVGGDIVVGDGAGQLSVFSLGGCGHDVCDPVWVGRSHLANEHIFGIPVVGDGFFFVQTTIDKPIKDSGRLLAFPLSGCGEATCKPAWVADLGGPVGSVSSPLVVVGDKVIVGTILHPRRGASLTKDETRLLAFKATGCGTFRCEPVQTFEGRPDGFQVAWAINADESTLFVSASPHFGEGTASVLAYDLAHCGAHCQPTWRSDFHGDITFSPPAVAGDVVFVGKGNPSPVDGKAGVLAFDARGCGKAHCDPLAFIPSSPRASYFGQPLAIANGRIAFVENDDSDFSSNVAIMSLP